MILAIASNENRLKVSVGIKNIEVQLGDNDIFSKRYDNDNYYEEYFNNRANFAPLSNTSLDIEVNSTLSIDDTVGGLFDFSETPAAPRRDIGLNFVLQPAEDLDVRIGFSLRVFIDFADLSNLALQLSITYGTSSYRKEIAPITYRAMWQALRLAPSTPTFSGLSLPAIKLEGIDIGEIVKELLEHRLRRLRGRSFPCRPAERGKDSPQRSVQDRLRHPAPAAHGFQQRGIPGDNLRPRVLAYRGIPATKPSASRCSRTQIGRSEEDGLAGIELSSQTTRSTKRRSGYATASTKARPSSGKTLSQAYRPPRTPQGETINYEDISTLRR